MLTQTQHPTTQAHATKTAAEVRELIASLHKLESALNADNLDLTALSAAKEDIKAKHSGLALSLRQTHDSACRSLKLHLEALPTHALFNALFEPVKQAEYGRVCVRFRGRDICCVIGNVLSALGRRVASPFRPGRIGEECEIFCRLSVQDATRNRRHVHTHYYLRPEYQALLSKEDLNFLHTFLTELGDMPPELAGMPTNDR